MVLFGLHFDGHHFAMTSWSLRTSLHGLNLYGRWNISVMWHTFLIDVRLVIGPRKVARLFIQIDFFDEGFDLPFILCVIKTT